MLDPRPSRQRAEFWLLSRQGTYEPMPAAGDGIYHCPTLPGFRLRLAWLFTDSPPGVEEALGEMERA